MTLEHTYAMIVPMNDTTDTPSESTDAPTLGHDDTTTATPTPTDAVPTTTEQETPVTVPDAPTTADLPALDPPVQSPSVDLGAHVTVQLVPCVTEDSNNCYWNALTHGNGQGRSFVTIDDVTTLCAPGEVLAEDFSCVPSDYYAIGEADYVPNAPVNQQVIIEPVDVAPTLGQPVTELAATGPGDVAGIVIIGASLVAAGLTIQLVRAWKKAHS